MTRPARPDFLILGAPKAGTTALHAALTQHPEVFMCRPKEPKYWISDDAPPPACRPLLAQEARERLLPAFAEDIGLLSSLTGEDFGDWLSTRSRGSFRERATSQSVSAPA